MDHITRAFFLMASGCLLMAGSGCKTLQSAMGQTTYAPSSYGTPALFRVLRDSSSTRADAVAAARELRTRNLSAIPDDVISDVIINKTLRAEARIEFIEGLTERSLHQFKLDYLEAALGDPDPRVAQVAGVAYYEWADTTEEQEAFLLVLLRESPHAVMRARAAQALRNMEHQYLGDLLARLQVETSASVAYAICEALADYRTQEAIDMLNEIANDVGREFTTDALLDGGQRIRAEDVRALAVKTVESAMW